MADSRRRDAWHHTSSVLAMIANVNSDPKKTRPFTPDDFSPFGKSRRGKTGIPVTVDNIEVLKALVPNQQV